MIREDGDETERRRIATGLDAECCELFDAWGTGETIDQALIDALFLRTAQHHARYNIPFRRYALSLGTDLDAIRSWRDIPPVPAAVFKQTRVAAFPAAAGRFEFHTSGTTQAESGRHFMEDASVYEAASSAIFQRLVLDPRGLNNGDFKILSLVPDSRVRPHSSLGYMVDAFMRRWNGEPQNFVRGDTLLSTEFVAAVDAARRTNTALCIFGTALGLLQLLDSNVAELLPLPPKSIIIETGGFKGRSTEISQAAFYTRIAQYFAVAENAIIAELGMTELTSQYYDRMPRNTGADAARDGADARPLDFAARVKTGPPWLLTRFLDAAGNEVPDGAVGRIAHTDLANRGSVLTVLTEDEGYRSGSGFVFLGRAAASEPRGCSIDAEDLRTRSA